MFGRKKKEAVSLPPKSSALGLLHMEWERQRMPSPGAMNYAYETLGLAAFTQIGASVAVRKQIHAVQSAPSPVVGHSVRMDGMPIVSGQVMSAPLFNTATGTFNTSANPHGGDAFPFPEFIQPGQAL